MVMKCTAVCFVAVALLCGTSNSQPYPQYQNPAPPALQNPLQAKRDFTTGDSWNFPPDPDPEPENKAPFEQRQPVSAKTVAVQCGEKIARVEVKKDLFGIGQIVSRAQISLGPCASVAEDDGAQVYIFETELHSCGSKIVMTDDTLIYSYTVNYDPTQQPNTPVVRTNKAAVIVECHYQRRHNVSSLPLNPEWISFSEAKVAEEFLYFTLKLMTYDWKYQRSHHLYYLGELINVEASVRQHFHADLRIYVESCVASVSSGMTSGPRYAFIKNHGCLVDAFITGSGSKFMERTVDDKLQFQLEAFKFPDAGSGQLYIACRLKATSVNNEVNEEYKACYYNNGWLEASGVHTACGSCGSDQFVPADPSTGVGVPGSKWASVITKNPYFQTGRNVRDVSPRTMGDWEGDVILGPLEVDETRTLPQ